jgi:hypothetical protein
MIRYRIVVGIKDGNLSVKMQLDPDLTLKKAIDMARQSESSCFRLLNFALSKITFRLTMKLLSNFSFTFEYFFCFHHLARMTRKCHQLLVPYYKLGNLFSIWFNIYTLSHGINLNVLLFCQPLIITICTCGRVSVSVLLSTLHCKHVHILEEHLCHKWPWIYSTCRKHFPVLSSFTTYYRVCS